MRREQEVLKRTQNSRNGQFVKIQHNPPQQFTVGNGKLSHPPVIVGFGPAGMFAGLALARMGYCPVILERGADVDSRVEAVQQFWKERKLSTESNVQFGEGGAGTFSDGKLTTRISDPRCSFILEEMIRHGAPEEIRYRQKPHVGTDLLRNVVKNIRQEIISLGGSVHFNTRMEEIILKDGKVTAVRTTQGEIPTQAVVLAVGHSARDTFEMLLQKQVFLEPKPFSVGVRIEQRQQVIDRGLYGNHAGHPALPKGEYQLSWRNEEERGVYTFCMCPGGFVVASSSEENTVVTNGMSEHAVMQKMQTRRWSFLWTARILEATCWQESHFSENWNGKRSVWAEEIIVHQHSRYKAFWKRAHRIFLSRLPHRVFPAA